MFVFIDHSQECILPYPIKIPERADRKISPCNKTIKSYKYRPVRITCHFCVCFFGVSLFIVGPGQCCTSLLRKLVNFCQWMGRKITLAVKQKGTKNYA